MYTYGYIIQLHYTAETKNTVKQGYSYLKILGGKIYVNIKFAIKKISSNRSWRSFYDNTHCVTFFS